MHGHDMMVPQTLRASILTPPAAPRLLAFQCGYRLNHSGRRALVPVRAYRSISSSPRTCTLVVKTFASGPKTGLVGPERFQDGALAGTYHGPLDQDVKAVDVVFDIGAGNHLSILVPVGSNLLRAGEAANAVTVNRDFCFEGSCELCQFEVNGGAQEVGSKAQPGNQELVRGCLTPVPERHSSNVLVKVLSEKDVWAEGVL